MDVIWHEDEAVQGECTFVSMRLEDVDQEQ